MLREKSVLQQQGTVLDKNSEPILPVFVERDPSVKKKSDIRPSPLTNFDL